jgi:hypothetical protein
MARKKPARPAKKAAKKAKKKAAPKAAARKTAKKAKKVAKNAVKKAKKTAKKVVATAKKAVKSAVVNVKAAKAGVKAPTSAKATVGKAIVTKKPNLDRPRKTVADIRGIPSSLGMADVASAAHSGREDLNQKLRRNRAASPAITAGDVDADWQSAEATGDEAPGGDNPTPDQDVVDEIGRALGVEYADDEELQGGAEISERDTHRWELDPSSKDDFEEED